MQFPTCFFFLAAALVVKIKIRSELKYEFVVGQLLNLAVFLVRYEHTGGRRIMWITLQKWSRPLHVAQHAEFTIRPT